MHKLIEASEKIQKMYEEVAKNGKQLFLEGVQPLFKKYPELKSFGWAQFTPYWQDGDECIFSVYTDYPFINKTRPEYDEDGNQYLGTELYNEIKTTIRSISDDIMKTIFGDHVKITVYENIIKTEEYDHD